MLYITTNNSETLVIKLVFSYWVECCLLAHTTLHKLRKFWYKFEFWGRPHFATDPPPPCVRMCPLLTNPPSPLGCGRPLWMAPYLYWHCSLLSDSDWGSFSSAVWSNSSGSPANKQCSKPDILQWALQDHTQVYFGKFDRIYRVFVEKAKTCACLASLCHIIFFLWSTFHFQFYF